LTPSGKMQGRRTQRQRGRRPSGRNDDQDKHMLYHAGWTPTDRTHGQALCTLPTGHVGQTGMSEIPANRQAHSEDK
jgi:hypothetical protein